MMFFGLGQALVTNFIGVAYPCFMSFYSIETTTTQEDDKQWLTYWVVFGVLSLAEQVAGGFLVQFVPFYWPIKLLILVWLFHPMTNGASVIYDNVVHPLWKEHEGRIEEVTKNIEGVVSQGIDKMAKFDPRIQARPKPSKSE